MSHRTNPSILASSAMNTHTSDHPHPHPNYYHEDELGTRHVHAHQHQQSAQQHQFQARLPASSVGHGLVHPVEPSTGAGGMFYPPSTFAAPRMAAHQYSAAPAPPPAPASAYHQAETETEFVEQDVPHSDATGTASTSVYFANTSAHAQAQAQSQYAPPPMSSLQPSLHSHAHPHHDPVPSVHQPGSVHGHAPAQGGPPSPTIAAARRHTTSAIGSWMTFATGPFAGRTVRAEVVEVQKADLGRKCADPPTSATGAGSGHGGDDREAAGSGSGSGSRRAKDREREHQDRERGTEKGPEKDRSQDGEARAVRKDRRPLDPPPVVSLQLFESMHHGTPHQHERAIPAEDVEIGGLICQVDLYRVTIPPSPTEVASLTLHAGVGVHAHGQTFQSQHGQGFEQAYTHPVPLPLHPHHAQHTQQNQHHQHQQSYSPYEQHGFAYPPAPHTGGDGLLTAEEDGSAASPLDGGWDSASPVSPLSPYTYHSHPAPHAHPHPTLNTHVPTLHTLNSPSLGAPIDPDALPPPSESDKLTRVLFGESYAHACSILDLSGRPALYFVFADLSVKLEGLFRPRYRFFDLFSRTAASADVPVLAQCFGGAFAVYSTKEFPGLKASTPLTKHLSRWGIRVNIRETERKRRAPDGGGASAGNGGGGGRGVGRGVSKDKRRAVGRRPRGGSVGAGASSGASVRGDGEEEEGQGSGETVSIPRGVDAPRRYLEGAVRGRGTSGRARTSVGGSSGSLRDGEVRGRGRKRD